MGLKCALGFHMWAGCRCTRCSAQRDQDHSWNGCICQSCGKRRDEGHDFAGGCRCTACGAVHHSWEHCQCGICGEQRDRDHKFGERECQCALCGVERHVYRPFKCLTCEHDPTALQTLVLQFKDSLLAGTLGQAAVCGICGISSPDYGCLACDRCGKAVEVSAIGAYLWDIALVGEFALSVSRAASAQWIEARGAIHSVLCVRVQAVLCHAYSAAQELAIRGSGRSSLQALSAACRRAWEELGDGPEHRFCGKAARDRLQGFLAATWDQGLPANGDRVRSHVGEACAFVGPGLQLTSSIAQEFVDRRTKGRSPSPSVLEARDKLAKVYEYDAFSVVMYLQLALYDCLPRSCPAV